MALLQFYTLTIEERKEKSLCDFLFKLLEASLCSAMPLLPLVFPLIWISINLWGVAKLECFLRAPSHLILEKNTDRQSFEEDLDTPICNYDYKAIERGQVVNCWWKLWQGDSKLLARSSNVVQVLGSITALCCIDKKGILSWPNPTAEKIFFLRDTQNNANNNAANNLEENSEELSMQSEPTIVINGDGGQNPGTGSNGIIAEVLDLTHDQHYPFRLEFDDHDWKNHIKSLKPLGKHS